MGDPLRARLFGYGVPYRVEVDEAGAVAPRPTDAAGEAERLCRALRQLAGRGMARLMVLDVFAALCCISSPCASCAGKGMARLMVTGCIRCLWALRRGIGRCWRFLGAMAEALAGILKSPLHKSRRGVKVRTRLKRSKPCSTASAPCSTN